MEATRAIAYILLFVFKIVVYSILISHILKTRREAKAEREKGLCPNCKYDIRGNTSGICPECGNPVDPPKKC